MASLFKESKGKIDSVHINPPLDVGADFTMNMPLREWRMTFTIFASLCKMLSFRYL